jgi:hypothetical protein
VVDRSHEHEHERHRHRDVAREQDVVTHERDQQKGRDREEGDGKDQRPDERPFPRMPCKNKDRGKGNRGRTDRGRGREVEEVVARVERGSDELDHVADVRQGEIGDSLRPPLPELIEHYREGQKPARSGRRRDRDRLAASQRTAQDRADHERQ